MVKRPFAVWRFCFARHGLPLDDVELSFVPEKPWTEWQTFDVKPAPAKEPPQIVAIPRTVFDEERNLERVQSEIAGHAIGEAGIYLLFPDFTAHGINSIVTNCFFNSSGISMKMVVL